MVIYQNPNARPTVPIESLTRAEQPSHASVVTSTPETVHETTQPTHSVTPAPDHGGTQRLQSSDFDKKTLPNRIQFLVRESGSIIEKAARAPLVIGRRNSSLPVDIDLGEFDAHEMGISRNHFRIEPAPNGKLFVIDLKAVNGTQLNGERLLPLRPYELRHGDEIRAGRIYLKVYFIY